LLHYAYFFHRLKPNLPPVCLHCDGSHRKKICCVWCRKRNQ